MSMAWIVSAPVIVLALAAFVAWVKPRIALPAGLVATVWATAWVLLVPRGVLLEATFIGLPVEPLAVDGVTKTAGLIFGAIGVGAVLYAMRTSADHRLASFVLFYVSASFGAVLAADWLSLIVWWELMAIFSTLAVWHHGGRAVRAGFRYAVLHGIGGTLLMLAIVTQYAATGSFLMEGGFISGVPAVLAMVGIGVNVGFVGLHAWLPDTYPSPHIAASVFLSVYTTKVGVVTMLRAFPEGHAWLVFMGAAMSLFGVTMALFQDDMRRLLSYHIQSQVGYMIAGIGIASALAQSGAIAHLFNNIVYKTLLFMIAGVVIYRTGHEKLSNIGGLSRAMPVTAGAFLIAALSIAGFPGFNGFVSKGMVTDAAAYDLGSSLVFWMLVIAGVGTFMSFIKFGYYAFYRDAPDTFDASNVNDARGVHKVVMVALSIACIVLAIPAALSSVVGLGGGPVSVPALDAYSVSHLQKGVVTAGVSLVAFVLVKKPLKRVKKVRDVDALYNPGLYYATRGILWGIRGIRRGVDAFYHALVAWIRSTLEDPLPGEDAPIGLSVFLVTLVLVVALIMTLV